MQDVKVVETELAEYKQALLIQNLSVKNDRTPEESELLKNLLLDQLAKLEKSSVLDSTSDSIVVPNFSELPEDQESAEDVAPKTRKVPTLAAQVNKSLNTGAVQVKREINSAYPDEKLGGVHTPVKTVGKDITNSRFFVSPGGTTAIYAQTVQVSVKKVSGGQFVETDNTEKSSINSSLTSSF